MPAAPNEETALLASSQKSSKSQKSKWWPSFLWTRYGKSEEPETNLPADDAHATERDASKQHPDDDLTKKPTILASVIVLYFGVWIATADTTLVTAVYNIISSDLSEFQDAMWILAAYQLGMAPAQPLYGKLSDIFGHKAMLTGAYLLFALGCLLCGTGNSLLHFSAGRVIAGAGGAGMRSLVSSLIVHFVPLRDVAVWRSWMYVVVTFGRSTGAPLGGVLTDTIGWRNAFIFQAPLVFVALILVWRRIPSEFEHKPVEADENASMGSLQTTLSKIRRIDFLGAFLLATSIVSFVLVFNLASKDLTFSDPWVISLIVLFFVSSFLFLFVEARVSSEPIFPLRLLLERDVLTAYLIIGFVLIGNICMVSSVPLYFYVAQRASNTVASLRLIPSIVGNTFGSILTGWLIKRTGRYRPSIIVASISCVISYLLLYLRWRTAPLAFIETLYVTFSGFGNGVSTAAVFVFLTAATRQEDSAIASGAFYLSMSLGEVAAIAVQNGVLQGTLGRGLPVALKHVEGRDQIIRQVLTSVSNIWLFPPAIQDAIIDTYVQGLRYSWLFALCCSIPALVLSFTVRERSLEAR